MTKAARLFGEQCVVASIDSLRVNNEYRVYDYLQQKALPLKAEEFARQLQDQGAGEVLINSVDQDGSQKGFDLELINSICAKVAVPVICCGGAGKPQHFIDAIENTQVSAVAAANFFHFTEHSVTITKAHGPQVPIRNETHASYENNSLDNLGGC